MAFTFFRLVAIGLSNFCKELESNVLLS